MIVLDLSQDQVATNNVLSDILHATGIIGEEINADNNTANPENENNVDSDPVVLESNGNGNNGHSSTTAPSASSGQPRQILLQQRNLADGCTLQKGKQTGSPCLFTF